MTGIPRVCQGTLWPQGPWPAEPAGMAASAPLVGLGTGSLLSSAGLAILRWGGGPGSVEAAD